jgi:hypothetical protein
METGRARPLRQRRLWLIVAFLLVLVIGVARWNWPRGDARFVGRWSYSTGGTVELRSNGVAINTFSPTDEVAFTWSVREGKLVFGAAGDSSLLRKLSAALETFLTRTIGYRISLGEETLLVVVQVSPTEVQLRTERGKQITLTRLPQ